MNAEYLLSPDPSVIFFFQELSDPVVPDIFKIPDFAHVIFGPVTFVKLFQTLTGKFNAIKAICILPFRADA